MLGDIFCEARMIITCDHGDRGSGDFSGMYVIVPCDIRIVLILIVGE
jgi:hypothetical protein